MSVDVGVARTEPRSPSDGSGEPRFAWLPITLILALAAFLRLYHLGAEDLWVDEVLSLSQTQSPAEGVARFWRFAEIWSARPLSLALLHYVLQIGQSQFLVRLPYAIVSIADVGALYLVARGVAGRRPALRAALFLAVLPLHVWYGQEARWYAQWSLLSTLSFWALLGAWKTGRWRWWAGYAVTAAMGLYTYVVSLQLLAAQAVTAWLLPRRDPGPPFRRRFVVAALIVLALSWPMIHIALNLRVDSAGPGGGMVGTPRGTTLVVVPYTFFSFVAGYTVGPTVAELHAFPGPAWILREFPEIVLYYAIFGTFALLGLWALRRRGPAAAIVLPWSVGLPLIVLASAILAGQTYNVRYGFAAVPGFALLLSLGVESLGRWRAVGTALAVALFAFSLGNYYWNPRYDKEHLREATSYIRSGPDGDAPVAVIGQGGSVAIHYAPDLALRRLYGCRPSEPDVVGRVVPAVRIEDLRAERRWWLLVSRDWVDYAGVCLERSEATLEVVEQRSFPGVELFLLQRR